MAHNDWGPDDFLDEFLDFDYGKPVPGHQNSGKSDRTPATENRAAEGKGQKKSYGLSDDSYKEYEILRHNAEKDAGKQIRKDQAGPQSSGARKAVTSAQNTSSPRSSSGHKSDPAAPKSQGVFKADIPEPLSARNASGQSFGFSWNDRPQTGMPADQDPAEGSGRDEAVSGKSSAQRKRKSGQKQKRKQLHASEMAAGAFAKAKKLVSSDVDSDPEVIPPAQSDMPVSHDDVRSSDPGFIEPPLSSNGASVRKEEERDELSELFAELGEPEPAESAGISPDEQEALRQASEEAYDRYRSNYVKSLSKSIFTSRVGFFPRWLSRIYVVVLAIFAVVMTIMNVLPFGMLIALYVVLGLLSIILLVQMRKERVRKWVRAVSCMAAVLLIAVYGLGTAYAMGTLSFLDATSVQNDSKVRSITREPFNVCITGLDVYGYIDEEGRSDVNMLVTVNPNTEQILMTSIPRDYQIYMPDKDYAMDKLTHTGFYGVNTTIAAEENLLDTKINYYVKVNFTTVKLFIYTIGGIDVYSEYEFNPVKMPEWTVKKGWNHMNGKQALAFARERKAFIDGDNQRIKNQQAVFEAVLKKATSSKTMILKYNKILAEEKDYFRMSFSSREMRALVKMQLARNPQWKIYKNTIIGGNDILSTYSGGNAYVMTQDQDSIDNAKALMNAVLEGKELDKDEDGNVFVVGAENEENTEDGEETEGQ